VFYFEDVSLGASVETPGWTLTEADVLRYVGLTGDWESRTTDSEFSRGTEGGTRVIPDLLPLCISIGLGWRIPHPPLVVLAFMGLEWKFLGPLRVGDTIRSRSKAVAKRAMKDGGVLVEEHEIVNQHGAVVQSGKLTFLVAKRPTT
jgi:acyl dehydratase